MVHFHGVYFLLCKHNLRWHKHMIIFIEDFFTYRNNLKCCPWIHVAGWGFSIGLPGAFIGALSFIPKRWTQCVCLEHGVIVIQSITLLFFSRKLKKTEKKKLLLNISFCFINYIVVIRITIKKFYNCVCLIVYWCRLFRNHSLSH